MTAPQTLLWLQAGSCGGCTMALLEQFAPDLKRAGLRILWHPSLSDETGEEAVAILEDAAAGRVAP